MNVKNIIKVIYLDLNTFKYTKICDHANNIDRILHGF